MQTTLKNILLSIQALNSTQEFHWKLEILKSYLSLYSSAFEAIQKHLLNQKLSENELNLKFMSILSEKVNVPDPPVYFQKQDLKTLKLNAKSLIALKWLTKD